MAAQKIMLWPVRIDFILSIPQTRVPTTLFTTQITSHGRRTPSPPGGILFYARGA